MSGQVDTGRVRLGGLRKRVKPFTPVPNDTIEDWTLSFRALGLLTRILRMPEGFVIRSEQLANEGQGKKLRGRESNREGRGAVRTALRELALGGYYRLEKVRTLKGAFVMQNAISEDPDLLWAEQAAIFEGAAVPLYEQPDGSLMVRYPDGTMHPDGFPPPEQVTASSEAPPAGDPEDQDDDAGDPAPPGTGFRSPGFRSPVKAASGEAASGDSVPLKKMVKEDGQQDSVPASQVRRGELIQGTIDGEDETLGNSTETTSDQAFGIANDWIKYRAGQGCPVAGGRPQHQLKSLILPFLDARYTVKEVKNAMASIGEGIPSRQQMQRELDRIRTGRRAPGRQERRSGADVNQAWADVRSEADQDRQFAGTSSGGASGW